MISIKDERTYEFRGLSTDKKPINDYISNGSIFIEMDTSLIYTYDSTNKNWLILDWNQGGGGGSPIEAGTGIEITGTDTKTISIDEDIVATKEDLPDEVSGTNDGTNWTSLTIGEDTYGLASSGSSVMVRDYADNEWSQKTWIGINPYQGNDVWTDGENVYYSSDNNQYVLDKSTSTWNVKNWNGLTNFYGTYTWTDGTNIYYSGAKKQYVLDKETSTWNAKTWNGLTNFDGSRIWSDGNNIYYSGTQEEQYVLDVANSTWNIKIWNGYIPYLNYTWSDGENVYYSYGENQYILNKSTSTWIPKTWNELSSFSGKDIWTHKGEIYCGRNWVLDKTTLTWNRKVWNNLNPSFWLSIYVWTDGDYTYYSYSSNQLVLDDTSTHEATILSKVAETGNYNDLNNIPLPGIDISSQNISDYFEEYCDINASVTEESIGEEETVNVLNLTNVDFENDDNDEYVTLNLNSDNVSVENKILNIE